MNRSAYLAFLRALRLYYVHELPYFFSVVLKHRSARCDFRAISVGRWDCVSDAGCVAHRLMSCAQR